MVKRNIFEHSEKIIFCFEIYYVNQSAVNLSLVYQCHLSKAKMSNASCLKFGGRFLN